MSPNNPNPQRSPSEETPVIVFPFDLFGSAGAAEGATLLGEDFREILDDNRRERVATRARAYTSALRIHDIEFETLEDYGNWRTWGNELASELLRKREFFLWLSGNHLGALPLYEQLVGTEDTLIVQFDAHLDIHHFSDCTAELSHGNFLLHCPSPLPAIVNVGHRDLLQLPRRIRRFYRQTYSAADYLLAPEKIEAELLEACASAKRIFLDIDCDVFDPAEFPAVCTPRPFGLRCGQVLRILQRIDASRIDGVFLSEFCPSLDANNHCRATLLWLLEYLLLAHHEAS